MRPLVGIALIGASVSMTMARPVSAQDLPAAPESQPAAEQAAPTVNPPSILENPPPTFPAAALADRVHGIVVVELTLTAEGTVKEATVGSLTIVPEEGQPRAGDGRYGFGPAAIEAAKQMVFRPAEYGGQPFEVQINYTYRFTLPPKAATPEEVVDQTRGVRAVASRPALLVVNQVLALFAVAPAMRGRGKVNARERVEST